MEKIIKKKEFTKQSCFDYVYDQIKQKVDGSRLTVYVIVKNPMKNNNFYEYKKFTQV